MRFATLIAVAVLAAAPMAFAQTEPAAPEAQVTEPVNEAVTTTSEQAPAQDTTPTATSAEPEQVCRTIERSESRLRSRRERVCRTQAEWDALQSRGRGE